MNINPFRKAAEAVPGHLHKGDYFDGNGNACAAGHVYQALGCHSQEDVDGWRDEPEHGRAWELLNQTAIAMFPDRGTLDIAEVNDHPDTTEDDIVSILEKAAVRWDEQV